MVLDVVRASPSPHPPFFFFFGLPCRPALTPRGHHHQSRNHASSADKSAPVRQAEPATRPPPRLIDSHHCSARPTVAVDAAALEKDPGRAAPPHRTSPALRGASSRERATWHLFVCLSPHAGRSSVSQRLPGWLVRRARCFPAALLQLLVRRVGVFRSEGREAHPSLRSINESRGVCFD